MYEEETFNEWIERVGMVRESRSESDSSHAKKQQQEHTDRIRKLTGGGVPTRDRLTLSSSHRRGADKKGRSRKQRPLKERLRILMEERGYEDVEIGVEIINARDCMLRIVVTWQEWPQEQGQGEMNRKQRRKRRANGGQSASAPTPRRWEAEGRAHELEDRVHRGAFSD